MICTSIQNKNLDSILEILDNPAIEMAEIRLDSCELSLDEIDYLFSEAEQALIATYRLSDKSMSNIAEAKLVKAIQAGAYYVDLDIDSPAMMSKRIRREAFECGTNLIRSYHNYESCDSSTSLEAIIDKCIHLGADIVKIVCKANSLADCERLMSLYDKKREKALVAFCMGEIGKESRIDCLKKGSPFSYASLNDMDKTADGQWDTFTMIDKIYGKFRMIGSKNLNKEELVLSIPCSKSYAQRAIIAASLAEGKSTLYNYSSCDDNKSALQVALSLGAKIKVENSKVEIEGLGKDLSFDKDHLNCGESGLLSRLMIPILAKISKNNVRIEGEKTLKQRQLAGLKRIMDIFNINVDNEIVPLNISHGLKSGNYELSGENGSQLISGLIYALSLDENASSLYIEKPKSLPYIFMTLDMLKHFSINIDNEMEGGEEFIESQDWNLCDAIRLNIPKASQFKANKRIELEADWSTAANFLVAAAIFGKIAINNLDTKSLQADLSILDILMEAGASMSSEEETNIIRVQRAALYAFDIDASQCPDLFPIISILATFCNGKSKIKGISRLINKESNRAEAILEMLLKLGVKASIQKDSLIIQGHSLCQRLLTNNLLKGGEFSSHDDHRMAMALKIAALGCDSPLIIDNISCINKSCPDFIKLYDML